MSDVKDGVSQSSRARAYSALALTMVFWASNAVVGRAMKGSVPPLTLAFGRWALALTILTPLALKPLGANWPRVRRNWHLILFLGLVGVAAFNGFLYSGLQYTTATNGVLLQATIPSLVILIGLAVFGDRPSIGQVAGVFLSTIGVLVIVFHGDVSTALALRLRAGDALVLCGCVAWAIYTACLRLRPPIEPIVFLFLTFCIGALAMAPFAAVELMKQPITVEPRVIGAFVYLGTFPSVIAYFLYNGAVARLGSATAGQAINLMPVFGALLAAMSLDEKLYAYHALGIAAILLGIAFAGFFGRKPRALERTQNS
jgi:drug/metabolite transporter (DMT)-like permease